MTNLHLRRDGIAWTDVDGEIVALDETAAVYLAVNETGGMLWRALSAGATREELAVLLVDAYGLRAEQASADIDTFLADLRERGLLAA